MRGFFVAKRQYNNNYLSVTDALNILRKIGLENWFKYNTAKFCDEKSARGKLIGTQFHKVLEAYITGGKTEIATEYGDEVSNLLNRFLKFRTEHPEFKLVLSEIPMTSEIYKYNGTMDAGIEREDIEILGDWKSGECKLDVRTGKYKHEKPPIYDEHKYQVSAYVNLRNEVFNKKIESAIIVAFAKDTVAYNLYEMSKNEIKAHFHDAFLPALKIAYHQKRGILWEDILTI